MIRPKLSLRRPFTVAAAGLAGLATTFAVVTPVTAANPTPTPTASPTGSPASSCVRAEQARYTHTFDGPKGEASITLTNGPLCAGEKQEFALVSYIAPSATFAVPQYVFDTSVKAFTSVAEGAIGAVTKLEFAVEVPACFTQVDFVFGSAVIDPITEKGDRYGDRKVGSSTGIGARSTGDRAFFDGRSDDAWYNGGAGTCVQAPAVEAKSDCTGGVELVLTNRGNVPATFTLRGSGDFAEKVTVPAGGNVTKKLTAEQGKEITAEARGMETWKGGWEKPADCQEPTVGEPKTSYDSTCKELTLQVTNPADGISLTSTFTPSVGEPKTVTFAPGTKKEVTFPAAEGLTVVVTGDLASEKPIAWTAPKGGCAGGGDGGTGGGDQEGGLPVTGAAAGGIAAGAAALLALGAVLFVVARRRRIRFTA
ncbi:cell wall anchor protein [Micromonospora sp. NPDC023956]|uniref:cell wall anchor protein n=1 Tax=Micromonospora sp. NPDC023956 TaxID=3155722 RepID=UPI0033F64404